jgi:DNA-binding NarL/FixJ family response regulator
MAFTVHDDDKSTLTPGIVEFHGWVKGAPMAYPRVDFLRDEDTPEARGIGLSDEDLLLLAELAKGVTVDRVGRRLDVSGRTVRRRLRGICDRIGVATAIEAVAWAARRQLI